MDASCDGGSFKHPPLALLQSQIKCQWECYSQCDIWDSDRHRIVDWKFYKKVTCFKTAILNGEHRRINSFGLREPKIFS